MCGLVGFCDFNKKSDQGLLKKITEVLHHRGPDDTGCFFKEYNKYQLGLGHKRLSILDLSKKGHQPMRYKGLRIVYNGEVYNYKEVRKELLNVGYNFVSNSDTEVVLKAFHYWRTEAPLKFNGMFAFAIFDEEEQRIYLFRDRSGVKPIYWYFNTNLLIFASELKSIHGHPGFIKALDINSVSSYLSYGYIPQPNTIYQNAYKLQGGHYLEVDLKQKKFNEVKYWDVIDYYNKPRLDISKNEAVNTIESIFTSAFDYRMVSDVPVGLFLSGGYDSSTVAAFLQKNRSDKIKTFTIGFYEEEFNEATYARKVAQFLGTDHTEYYCSQEDALEIIPELSTIFDEPFGDSSAIPTILLSKIAREKVKVSLSADAGDEIFGGYLKYYLSQKYFNLSSGLPEFVRSNLIRIMEKVNPSTLPLIHKRYNFQTRFEKVKNILKENDPVGALKFTSQYFTTKDQNKFITLNFEEQHTCFNDGPLFKQSVDNINRLLAIDYKTYLIDDILTKIDRATMSVGLEGREPLLDYRIIEFVAQLPSTFKYDRVPTKELLKIIAHKHLPKDLMERPKKGFGVPISYWFKDKLKDYFMDYLNESRLSQEGIFNSKEIIKLRNNYLIGSNENVQRLWLLLMFEMWYERWM